MTDTSPAPEKETRAPSRAQESGNVFRADVPLAILESVRQHDRPSEVLEDEDLTVSLPRRLGLKGVVDNQIRRYRTASKRREKIPADDVANLLRLVLRRPDADAVLREAGQSLARRHGRPYLHKAAGIARLLPDALSSRIVRRVVRRLMNRIGGGARTKVSLSPLRVEVGRPVTSRLPEGAACVLYGAAIEEAVDYAIGRRPDVQHVECASGSGGPCIWTINLPTRT